MNNELSAYSAARWSGHDTSTVLANELLPEDFVLSMHKDTTPCLLVGEYLEVGTLQSNQQVKAAVYSVHV